MGDKSSFIRMNDTIAHHNISSSESWNYPLVGYWRDNCDPYSAVLPGISLPWITVITIALYLDFVKRWGPKMMANKPAYELRSPMLIYNTFMVVINAYFLYKSIVSSFDSFSLYCFLQYIHCHLHPLGMARLWSRVIQFQLSSSQ